MKYEHLNFTIQNYENSATTTYFPINNKYNTCTLVTNPVYIGSKIKCIIYIQVGYYSSGLFQVVYCPSAVVGYCATLENMRVVIQLRNGTTNISL